MLCKVAFKRSASLFKNTLTAAGLKPGTAPRLTLLKLKPSCTVTPFWVVAHTK